MRKIVFVASLIALVCAVLAFALLAPPSGPTGTSAEHYPCDPPPEHGTPQGEPIPFSFTNDTGVTASDLCVVFAGTGGSLNSVQVTANPPGCPGPPPPAAAAAGDNRVYLDWGMACIDDGETVQITVQSAFGPVEPVEVVWTLEGEPITPTPPPEETATPTPTPVEETPTPSPVEETVAPTPTPTEETPTPHKTKNPIDDDWPDLSAAEEKAVKDLVDVGKKADALAKLVDTMKKYCCSFGTMKDGAPVYDSKLKGEGSTERKKGGVVKIGDASFSSVAWLYSSLKHEMVHSQQWQDPDEAKKDGSKGREKEAYQREIDNADNTDISEKDKKDLEKRIKRYNGGGGAQVGSATTSSDTLGLAIGLATDVFKSDEPIPLTMTLENLSAGAVQANTRLFVNDAGAPPPFREVSLSITPMGSADEVEFGWDIRVGFPGEKDFSELGPDATVENTVDIADLYLLEPGRYEVCANYENTMAGPTVFDEDSGEFVEEDVGAVKTSVDSDCLAFLIGPFGNQGDVDCDDDQDSVDALQTLRKTAALSVSQNAPCPEIGSEFASLFGDVDCDGSVGAVDALKILRSVAALSVAQTEPCPDIGGSLAPAAPASQATATGSGLPIATAAGLAAVAVGLVTVGGVFSRRRWRDDT